MPLGKVAAPAGMLDTIFGVSSIRQLPPLMAVEITSTYSCETGYSWKELRGSPGVGTVEMTVPMTGDKAYDLTGSTELQPGSRALISIDRDQTIYWILFVFLFEPCCASGSGSGSGSDGSGSGSCGGSGSGCDTGVTTVSVANVDGTSTLTAKSLKIGLDGNRLTLLECSTQDYDLGPGGVDPGGVTLPVVTNVCPQFTTIQYLDWDSNPQSIEVVTGIIVERRLVTVPVAEEERSCVTNPEDCCGSGSGSGEVPCNETTSPCVSSCGQCSPMSAQWLFAFGALNVNVCNLGNPNDGNPCRFVSADLNWELRYDTASGLWTLENYATGAFYYISGTEWNCTGDNVLTDVMGGESITISPVNPCGDVPVVCDECPGGIAHAEFEFTLSTITNANCVLPATCEDNYNRTVRLTYGECGFVGGCCWFGPPDLIDCASGPIGTGWKLQRITGIWLLQDSGGKSAAYSFEGEWDCQSPLTLNFGFNPNACSSAPCCDGWPPTITITPV